MRKGKNDYTEDWSEVATRIKKEAGWKCVRCGHPHDPENGYTLTIHHLNMDKADNSWHNCPPLCQACHLHIQGKVIMEQPYMFEHSSWFKVYAAGYYAAQHGHPTAREWVMANLDMLLAYGRPR